MSDSAILARDLSKTYRVYDSPRDRLLELLGGRSRHREFRALSGVDFKLERGESLGVIGENGAGKSTLLKILAGLAQPTSGEVEVRGKVASILELGSGFHPEFSGRENAVLNAAMLGLTEQEVAAKLPAIEAFSELGEFLEQPVKCYSTGMAMRLGFSIATQVEPEVLIIDEALSVGDGYFQKKCMDRLVAMVESGTTLLFCSHAMYYITGFCRRALWLKKGEVAGLGPAHDVVRDYENFLLAKAGSTDSDSAPEAASSGAGPARFRSVTLSTGETYRRGDRWRLDVEWESDDPDLGFHLGVGINRIDDLEVASFGTQRSGREALGGRRSHRASLILPDLPLVKGEFMIYVHLLDADGLHIYDQELIRPAFRIENADYGFGVVDLDHAWELAAAEAEQPVAAGLPVAEVAP